MHVYAHEKNVYTQYLITVGESKEFSHVLASSLHHVNSNTCYHKRHAVPRRSN